MDTADIAGKLLQDILANGLGDLEGAAALKDMQRREAQEDEAQRRREIKIVTAAIDVSSEAGVEFLKWLALKTVLRPPTEAELGAKTVEEAGIASQRRIGQNQIFFMLVEVLRHARMAEPKSRRSAKHKGSEG
jgi:hypothetical protein